MKVSQYVPYDPIVTHAKYEFCKCFARWNICVHYGNMAEQKPLFSIKIYQFGEESIEVDQGKWNGFDPP